MGVTPTSGGPMPRYILPHPTLHQLARPLPLRPLTGRAPTTRRTHPRIPSLASVCLTTSSAPVYVPGAAVCRRTFVRSKGWPGSGDGKRGVSGGDSDVWAQTTR